VIALLLGAPSEDIERIKEWSDQLAAYLGGRSTARTTSRARAPAWRGCTDYFTRSCARRAATRATT
jgi:cytochrome P450